jgi:hypothetical protein
MVRTKEHSEYAAFMRRSLAAFGRRLAEDGDPEDLAELLALKDAVEFAAEEAVRGMRSGERAYSWEHIARGLGTSRQAVHRRFKYVGGVREVGGQPVALR